MLPEEKLRRLTQLLGMLGSRYDGEVLNAAKLAHRLLTDYKLQWGEVLYPASRNGSAAPGHGFSAERGEGWEAGYEAGYEAGQNDAAQLYASALQAQYERGFAAGVKSVNAGRTYPRQGWKAWAHARVDEDHDCLSDWEIKFFGSFAAGRYAVPSEKQRAIFERVAARLDLELPG